MRATPGIEPTACASSCAIARGGLRSVRASWKATVTARSPSARFGGTSTANGGTSVEAELPADRVGDRVVDVSLNAENHGREFM